MSFVLFFLNNVVRFLATNILKSKGIVDIILIFFYQMLTMRLTESTSNMMISTLNDPEEPFTSALELVATSVTGSLTNVLKSASGSSQDRADLAATTTSQEVRIANTGSKIKMYSPTYSLASSFFDYNFS